MTAHDERVVLVCGRLTRRRGDGPDDVVVPPYLAATSQDGSEAPSEDEGPVRVVPGT